MKIICAWCNKIIREGDDKTEEVSHGICPECYERVITQSTYKEK